MAVLILLGAKQIVFSQSLTITGSIVEKTSNEPLEGATVALYQKHDSSLVKGITSNSIGSFELTKVKPGNYFISVQFIGFSTYTISELQLTENKNLGIINLELSDVFLEAVSVTEEKSLFENKLDKKIYHVAKDIMAESSSAVSFP